MSKTLAELKPGDEVVVFRNRRVIAVEKVKSITRTGRINVSDGYQYAARGGQVGSASNTRSIEPRLLKHEDAISHSFAIKEARVALYTLRCVLFDDIESTLTKERADAATVALRQALAALVPGSNR